MSFRPPSCSPVFTSAMYASSRKTLAVMASIEGLWPSLTDLATFCSHASHSFAKVSRSFSCSSGCVANSSCAVWSCSLARWTALTVVFPMPYHSYVSGVSCLRTASRSCCNVLNATGGLVSCAHKPVNANTKMLSIAATAIHCLFEPVIE